jgi:adenosylcobyric acid synthase
MAAKSICLLSLGSGSGKTVIGNALAGIFTEDGHKTAFFKALTVAKEISYEPDGNPIARQMLEYCENCQIDFSHLNNPVVYDRNTHRLFLNGTAIDSPGLLSLDNLQTDKLDASLVSRLKKEIERSIKALSNTNSILIIEGGGNCLLEQNNDFTNRWPAEVADADVVLILNGADGSFSALLAGFCALAPESLRRQVRGFVVNGVLANSKQLRSSVRQMERKTGIPNLGIIPWFEFGGKQTWKESIRKQVREQAPALLALAQSPNPMLSPVCQSFSPVRAL